MAEICLRDTWPSMLSEHRCENLIALPSFSNPTESYAYFGKDTLVFGFLFKGIIKRLDSLNVN